MAWTPRALCAVVRVFGWGPTTLGFISSSEKWQGVGLSSWGVLAVRLGPPHLPDPPGPHLQVPTFWSWEGLRQAMVSGQGTQVALCAPPKAGEQGVLEGRAARGPEARQDLTPPYPEKANPGPLGAHTQTDLGPSPPHPLTSDPGWGLCLTPAPHPGANLPANPGLAFPDLSWFLTAPSWFLSRNHSCLAAYQVPRGCIPRVQECQGKEVGWAVGPSPGAVTL